MNGGVIYYNAGTSHLVRMMISLATLRRFYGGPVTILSEENDSSEICFQIAEALQAEVKEWNCGIPAGKNRRLLAKTRYHLGSPYDITIALDSDTLILGPIEELFRQAQDSEFCVAQFADWKSYDRIIAQRIRAWSRLRASDVKSALAFGTAINCGVIAFQKNAVFCRDWLQMALPGRNLFIPDEVICQLTLHRYPHRILDRRWNCSCKYDNPDKLDTRIIHYHGGKHCRVGLPFHGRKWTKELENALKKNLASLREWMPAGDRTLIQFLQFAVRQRIGGVFAKIMEERKQMSLPDPFGWKKGEIDASFLPACNRINK
jgi:hypothetical protein